MPVSQIAPLLHAVSSARICSGRASVVKSRSLTGRCSRASRTLPPTRNSWCPAAANTAASSSATGGTAIICTTAFSCARRRSSCCADSWADSWAGSTGARGSAADTAGQSRRRPRPGSTRYGPPGPGATETASHDAATPVVTIDACRPRAAARVGGARAVPTTAGAGCAQWTRPPRAGSSSTTCRAPPPSSVGSTGAAASSGRCPRATSRRARPRSRRRCARSRRRPASSAAWSRRWAPSTSGSSPRTAACTRPCTTSCCTRSVASSPTRTSRCPKWPGCRSASWSPGWPTPTSAG